MRWLFLFTGILLSTAALADCDYSGQNAKVVEWFAPERDTDDNLILAGSLKEYYIYRVSLNPDGHTVKEEIEKVATVKATLKAEKKRCVFKRKLGNHYIAMRVINNDDELSDYSNVVPEN